MLEACNLKIIHIQVTQQLSYQSANPFTIRSKETDSVPLHYGPSVLSSRALLSTIEKLGVALARDTLAIILVEPRLGCLLIVLLVHFSLVQSTSPLDHTYIEPPRGVRAPSS